MSYRVRWNTPITLFPNRCCLQLGAVFSLVRASARWKRCNLTAYRLYNWCRSWHECAPSCRHAEILRLNRKISIDVRKSNSVSELLWSQLSSVSTNWTSEPLLCPSPAASFPTSDFQSLHIAFPKQEMGTLSEGESLWKNASLLGIKAMEVTKGLQKTMKDILLVVLLYTKFFSTLSHLLQACNNKTSIFTLSPGWNLVEN